MAFGVGVEEVIGAGVVLVDAFLDQAHPEDAAVEVEILLRRAGDRGDVVEPVDAAHLPILSASGGAANDQFCGAPRFARVPAKNTATTTAINAMPPIASTGPGTSVKICSAK